MIHLKVSENDAQIALQRVQHQRFRDGIRLHWKVDDDGTIDGRSVCWLFCWGKTGMNSDDAAMVAQRVFNEICDISFDRFDAKVPHGLARSYRSRNMGRVWVDAELEKLLS